MTHVYALTRCIPGGSQKILPHTGRPGLKFMIIWESVWEHAAFCALCLQIAFASLELQLDHNHTM